MKRMWLPISFFKPKSEKTPNTEKWSTLTIRKSITLVESFEIYSSASESIEYL